MQNNDIHGIAIQWTQRFIKKSEHVYTFVEISRLCIMWQLLWGFAKSRPPASFPRPTAHDGPAARGPRPTTASGPEARKPGGPVLIFHSFFAQICIGLWRAKWTTVSLNSFTI